MAAVQGHRPDRVSSARQSSEKEAKALSVELADLLMKKDPWHQDAVFARENLRRHCLALIFQPVLAAGAGHANGEGAAAAGSQAQAQARRRLQGLNVLFLSTSHNVIHHFRQRLSAMDKLLAGGATRGSSNNSPGRSSSSRRKDDRGGARGDAPNPAQRRKLLHSFRDFLNKEEIFWRDLLIRIVGVFDVDEARPALRLLQLGVGEWEAEPAFQSSKEVHDQAILLCHKTLICYGDIARYRELYSESTSNRQPQQPRPRGGKLNPAAQATAESSERDWSRAYEAYHQARLLVPDDGNPSNQLAVLSGYQQDSFGCIYHYYRALCVKKAFITARDNISTTINKVLKGWEDESQRDIDKRRTRNGSYRDADGSDRPGANWNKMDSVKMLDEFKKQFNVLHAMLFQGSHLDALPQQFTTVTQLFSKAVARRVLPSDVIVKVIVTAISAWWYARMYKRSASQASKAPRNVDPASLESSALMHALAIIAELFGMAISESRNVQLHETLQPPPTAPASERNMLLAQSITAVLRRALPAMRIASMWLLSNADYLSRYDTTSASFRSDDKSIPPEVCSALRGFWTSYSSFANALSTAFPLELLPVSAGDMMLEEDIDMLGFAPLRRRMKDVSIAKSAKGVSSALTAAAATNATLHPNEEQVLRLGDLLGDANLLATSDSCPVVIERGFFTIRTKRLNPASQPWNPVKPAPAAVTSPPWESEEVSDEEDGNDFGDFGPDDISDHLTTEDDVLDLAMRVATGNTARMGDEDEESEDDLEEILYPARIVPPVLNRLNSNTPSPPAQPAPGSLSQISAPAATSRTASDLLLQVLQGNSMDIRPPGPGPTTMASIASAAGPPPGFPGAAFAHMPIGGQATNPVGSSGNFAGRSIWSAGGLPIPTSAGGSPSAQHQRLSSGSTPMLGAVGTGKPSAGGNGAEALFNSMPNQSQSPAQQGGTRFSPNLGSPGLDGINGIRSSPFGQFGSGQPASAGFGTNHPIDIWAPPSPQRATMAPRQSSPRAVPQRAYGSRQSG